MKKLKDIAFVRSGYPFRKAVEESADGWFRAIQIRDVSREGGINWDTVAHTNLSGGLPTYFLREGDLLFMSRGKHNFAVTLNELPGNETICTSHMFYIVLETDEVLPEFLSIQLNTKKNQSYFTQHAKGSDKKHIPRDVLQNVEIVIPNIQIQQHIIELHKNLQNEKRLVEELLDNNNSVIQYYLYGGAPDAIDTRQDLIKDIVQLNQTIEQELMDLIVL